MAAAIAPHNGASLTAPSMLLSQAARRAIMILAADRTMNLGSGVRISSGAPFRNTLSQPKSADSSIEPAKLSN